MSSYKFAGLKLRQTFSFLVRKTFVCLLITILIFAANASAQQKNIGKLRKQAQKAHKDGNFRQAERFWTEILEENPEHYESRLGLSYAMLKQFKYVESYQEANKAVKAQPKNALGYALLGTSLLRAGNFKGAAQTFNHSLSLNPEEPLALAGSAMLDYYENRSRDGIAKLRQAIYFEPREPDFYYYLAQVASRAERYKDAANAYQQFLDVAPYTDSDRRERILGLIEFLRYLGSQRNLYQISGKSQTVVTTEIINNRPVIPVKINGSDQVLRFVLDTGSAISVISDETALRLGLKPVAQGGKARAVGGDGKFNIVYGFLDTLEIGDIKASKIPVYIRKFYQTQDKVDGYIGINLISKYLTTLDYNNKYFSLVRLEKEKDGNKDGAFSKTSFNNSENDLSVPLRITSSGFLSGNVSFEGVSESLNFIIDTGASITVVNADVAQFYQLGRYAQPTSLRVYGAAGVTENVPTLRLPRVSLGFNYQEKLDAAILNLATISETAGFEQDGILGGNFLRNYRLTFDFRNARLLLEPSRPATQKSVTDAIVGEIIKKQ